MKQPGISLCMIMRDEEELLERCLSSVVGWITQIVIVDTGSVDRSVEIARQFGAQVTVAPWGGNFAEARNLSLEHASESWILVLDADERWAGPSGDELARLLARDEVVGYNVRLHSYVGQGEEQYYTDQVCRIFRNDPRIRYAGMIHEDVSASVAAFGEGALADSGIDILHYGYLDEVLARKGKTERNVSLLQEAIRRQPDDAHLLYALGTEWYQLGRYEEVLVIFEALRGRLPVSVGYLSDIWLKSAYALWETGAVSEARRMAEEGLALYPDFTDLLELQAMLLGEEGRAEEAVSVLERALAAGDVAFKYTTSSGAGTYRTWQMIGAMQERLARWADACRSYEQALAFHPGYVPAWRRLLAVCAATGRLDGAAAVIARHAGAGSLPALALEALLDAPAEVHHRLLDVWLSNPGPTLLPGQQVAGIVALQVGRYKEALTLFTLNAADASADLGSAIGAIHALAGLANAHADALDLPLPASNPAAGSASSGLGPSASRVCAGLLAQPESWSLRLIPLASDYRAIWLR